MIVLVGRLIERPRVAVPPSGAHSTRTSVSTETIIVTGERRPDRPRGHVVSFDLILVAVFRIAGIGGVGDSCHISVTDSPCSERIPDDLGVI